MKRIHALLSIILVALVTGAWVIKDTANSVDIYTGSNTTPSISAATSGAVTLGPVAFTATPSQVNGSLRLKATSVLGTIGTLDYLEMSANTYRNAAGSQRASSTATGYGQLVLQRPPTTGSAVLTLYSDTDAQTADSSLVGTTEKSILNVNADGATTIGQTSGTQTHTINGQLRTTNQFMYYRFGTGNSVGSAVTSHTDLGTLDANFVGVAVPRAGNYRIKFAASVAGNTTNSSGIGLSMGLRKSTAAAAYASSVVLGPGAVCQVGNAPTGTFRPECQDNIEYIGALAANDKIYFSIIFFDNPVTAGSLGGGSVQQVHVAIEELTASTIQ